MDRAFLKMTIENLEREKSAHDQKFGSNPVHANCITNFDQAILRLQTELIKLEKELESNAV